MQHFISSYHLKTELTFLHNEQQYYSLSFVLHPFFSLRDLARMLASTSSLTTLCCWSSPVKMWCSTIQCRDLHDIFLVGNLCIYTRFYGNFSSKIGLQMSPTQPLLWWCLTCQPSLFLEEWFPPSGHQTNATLCRDASFQAKAWNQALAIYFQTIVVLGDFQALWSILTSIPDYEP